MKHAEGFVRSAAPPDLGQTAEIPADEGVIGWYRNPAPFDDCYLVFSTDALFLVNSSSTTRVAWKDILGYESPELKGTVTGVTIRTRAGALFVPIAGSHGPGGKFKDAFSLVMVLQGIAP
jgi:hypothetical protein